MIGALKEIEGGGRAGKAEDLFYKTNGSIQDKDSVEDTKVVCSSFPFLVIYVGQRYWLYMLDADIKIQEILIPGISGRESSLCKFCCCGK